MALINGFWVPPPPPPAKSPGATWNNSIDSDWKTFLAGVNPDASVDTGVLEAVEKFFSALKLTEPAHLVRYEESDIPWNDIPEWHIRAFAREVFRLAVEDFSCPLLTLAAAHSVAKLSAALTDQAPLSANKSLIVLTVYLSKLPEVVVVPRSMLVQSFIECMVTSFNKVAPRSICATAKVFLYKGNEELKVTDRRETLDDYGVTHLDELVLYRHRSRGTNPDRRSKLSCKLLLQTARSQKLSKQAVRKILCKHVCSMKLAHLKHQNDGIV